MPIKRDQHKAIQGNIGRANRPRTRIDSPSSLVLSFKEEQASAEFKLNNIRYSGILFSSDQYLGSFDASANTAYTVTSGNIDSGSGGIVATGTTGIYEDTSKTWVANEWVDHYLITDGRYYQVKSNTVTQITLYDLTAQPENGDYSLAPHKTSRYPGAFIVPDQSIPAKFKITSNTDGILTAEDRKVSVFTGELSGDFGFAVLSDDGSTIYYCPANNVLNSSASAFTVSLDVKDEDGNDITVQSGFSASGVTEAIDFTDWYIFFADGDAAGETGTVTAYSASGGFTIAGITGTPASGDSFIIQADLNSFDLSAGVYVYGQYDLFDTDFDNEDWEDLQKTYIISTDGDFHLDQADSGYNARYTVQYYSIKATTIPISASFSGTYRVVVNDTEQLNSVGTGSIQVRPGWNRLDIYYYTPDGGALYISGANKPLGHYFTMWRDPSPSAPVWSSTSGFGGITAQEGQVELKWENAYGLSVDGGTEIYYQESGDASFAFLERVQVTTGTQSFIHAGLDGSTTYVYKLRHYTAQGDISSYTSERNGVVAADVPADGVIPSSVDVLDSDIYYASGEVVSIEVRFPYRLTAAPTVTVGLVSATLVGDTSTDHTLTTWSFEASGSEGTIEIAASATTVYGSSVTGTKDVVFDFTAPVLVSGDLVLDSNSNVANGDTLYCVNPDQVFIRAPESVTDSSGVPYLRLLNAFYGTGSSAGAGVLTDANLATADFNSVSFLNYILTDSDGVEHTITSYAGDPLVWTVSGTPVNGAYTVSKYSRTVTTSWDEVDFSQNIDTAYSLFEQTPWSILTIPDGMEIDNGFRVYMAAIDRADNVSTIISDDIHYDTAANNAPVVSYRFVDAGTTEIFVNENGWFNQATVRLEITATTVAVVIPIKSIFYSVDGVVPFTEDSGGTVTETAYATLNEGEEGTVEFYATTVAIDGPVGVIQVNYKWDKTIPTWTPAVVPAVGSLGSIEIGWGASPADTLSGPNTINVYRHTSDASGSATLIANIPYTQMTYTDQTALPYTDYYYWIQAVDMAGNVSTYYDAGGPVQTNAITISSMFRDAADQVYPNGNGWLNNDTLYMRITAGTINGGVNITSITYRINASGSWVTTAKSAVSAYVDVPVTEADGTVEAYATTAKVSSPIFEFGYKYDKTIPTWTPGAISPVGGFERIIVGWTDDAIDTLSGLSHVEIYRHTADVSTGSTLIATTSYEYVGYVDTEVDFGIPYYYWAKTVDLADNKTAYESLGEPVEATQIVPAYVEGALRVENPYDDETTNTWAVRYGIRVPIEAVTFGAGTLEGLGTITAIQNSVNGTDWDDVAGVTYNGISIALGGITLTDDTVFTVSFTPVQTANYWRITFDDTVSGRIEYVNFNSILAADLIVAGVLRLETGLTIWSGSYDPSGDATGSGVAIDQGGLQLWDSIGDTTVALYGTAVGGNIAVFGKNAGRQVVVTEDGDVLIDGGALTIGSGNNLVLNSDLQANSYYWTLGSDCSRSSAKSKFGTHSILVAANGHGVTGNADSDLIEIDKDLDYMVSLYIDMDNFATGIGNVFLREYDSTGGYLAQQTVKSLGVNTADFTRHEKAITSFNASTTQVLIRVNGTIDLADPEFNMYVDGFQLEQIDNADQEATAWRPAGYTSIDGNTIVTGKVQSVDENTFFDLDNSRIEIAASGGSAAIVLDGSGSGDVAVFGTTSGKQVRVESDGDVVVEGGTVKTGKVESTDGSTYFDLDNNIINIDDATGDTAIAFNGAATGDLAVIGSTSGRQVIVDSDGGVTIGGQLAISAQSVISDNFETDTLNVAKWTLGGSAIATMSGTGVQLKTSPGGSWNGSLRSVQYWKRSEAPTLEFDVEILAISSSIMIGWGDDSGDSYTNGTDLMVFVSGVINSRDSASGATALTTGVVVGDKFRCRITLRVAGGAKFQIYKNGDFTTPFATAERGSDATENNYIFVPIYQSVDQVKITNIAVNSSLDQGTIISGNTIQTGKVESTDGSTYFDLDNNKIVVDDGTSTVELSADEGLVGTYDGNKTFDVGVRNGRGFFRGGLIDQRLSRIPLYGYAFGYDILSVADSLTGFTDSRGLMYADGFIWATDYDNGNVKKIDPNTFTVSATYNVGASSGPWGIAWDGTNVWVACHEEWKIEVISTSGAAVETITFGTGANQRSPYNMAWDGTYMWVTIQNGTTTGTEYAVYRVHGTTYAVTGITLADHDDSFGICFDGEDMWVSPLNADEYYYTIDVTGTSSTKSSTLSGFHPGGMMFDGRDVWASNSSGAATDNLLRNLSTGSEYLSISTPLSYSIAFDGEFIWVKDNVTLYAFSIKTKASQGTFTVSSNAYGGNIVYDGQAVYSASTTAIDRFVM